MNSSTPQPLPAHAGGHSHDMALPRVPLLGMAFLVLATLLVVAVVRLSGLDISSASATPVKAERLLHFDDRADGAIIVRLARPAAGEDEVLRVVEPGSQGFLRGTLRALVRERRLAGIGAQLPFHLAAHADGRLTLTDTATQRRVDLESFGPTNAAAFAQLLPGPRAAATGH
jgi:putative photosynthetic complex assembly protein